MIIIEQFECFIYIRCCDTSYLLDQVCQWDLLLLADHALLSLLRFQVVQACHQVQLAQQVREDLLLP